ncbi:MAG TPA: protein-methionine-sulfoxide reductase catalytic subunit MsrP [Anaerolineaceae bacterium]|nr:protein-methionine-sulfoxide reductase catalytic subunit MsrP [Anaerolineaceae bacterium]
MENFKSSDITPEHVYFNRRRFLKGAFWTTTAAVLAACTPRFSTPGAASSGAAPSAAGLKDELSDPANSYQDITNYNNYYEFTTDKAGVAPLSQNFITSPWQVKVGGLVNNPKTYDIDDIRKKFTQEERIYRLRCVEGWSLVIPWEGFALNKLLAEVQPTSDARYVRFESVYDPRQMPGQNDTFFQWPYVEGLRVDEAMNDLTLLATGLYGKTLPNQDGAPVRLVVPWKYGFKNIKAIVKIDLVKEMPVSLWMLAARNEYGFYANVNPEVPHPRWSQSTELRIGSGRRPTLKFNGYSQVSSLYDGMDLKQNF